MAGLPGAKTNMPSKKPTAVGVPNGEAPMQTTRLIQRIVQNLDLDKLCETLAGKLSEKLLSNANTDDLVVTLSLKCQDDFKDTLTQAILERL